MCMPKPILEVTDLKETWSDYKDEHRNGVASGWSCITLVPLDLQRFSFNVTLKVLLYLAS